MYPAALYSKVNMNTQYTSPSQEDEASKKLWKRSGECIRCGKCCNSVVTVLTYCPELDDYMTWLSYHVGVSVTHNIEKGLVYVEFANKCRWLKFRGGSSECTHYHLGRPKLCREFPTNPTAGASCKGFTFEYIGSTPEPPPTPTADLTIQEEGKPSFERDPANRPKFERTGECLRCGKCCNTIVTTMQYRPEIRDYLEWLSLHQGVIVKHDRGTGVVWIEFKNKCRHLKFKRDKALCKTYDDRPKICRDFPLDPVVGRNCKKYVFKLHDPA